MSRRQDITVAMLKEDMWCPNRSSRSALLNLPSTSDGRNRFPGSVATLEAGVHGHGSSLAEGGDYVGIVSDSVDICRL
jgi:hypothetical protein